jgi:hypothetical protein
MSRRSCGARTSAVNGRGAPTDGREGTLVSVVVPVFNVATYIERCIGSLLAQSHPHLELILVDDGSTDRSRDLCSRYASLDGRVQLLNQANGGLSAARNAGLARATGEFVCFVDSDDWVEPRMLEELLAVAGDQHADVVIAGCFADREDGNGALVGSTLHVGPRLEVVGEGPVEYSETFLKLLGYAWNKFYRRSAIGDARFEPGLSLVEDIVFNRDVLRSSARTVAVDRAYVHYVQRPRTSLGTESYPDYLELQLRAVDCRTDLMRHWGASEFERRRTRQHLQARAFWQVTLQAASSGDPDFVRRSRQGPKANRARREIGRRPRGRPVLEWAFTWAFYRVPPSVLLLALNWRAGILRHARTVTHLARRAGAYFNV